MIVLSMHICSILFTAATKGKAGVDDASIKLLLEALCFLQQPAGEHWRCTHLFGQGFIATLAIPSQAAIAQQRHPNILSMCLCCHARGWCLRKCSAMMIPRRTTSTAASSS